MDEEINKLEYLLKDIKRQIENRLFIETKSLEDINETMLEWKEKGLSKIHIDAFRNYLVDEKSMTNSKHFYEVNIPKIKLLLTSAIEDLNRISQHRETKTKNSQVGISSFTPNQEFKALLEKGLLKSEQEIFGHFKKQTFFGHLTNEGFFNLIVNGKNILCSDFKYATLIAWGKQIPNDGWKFGVLQIIKLAKQKLLTTLETN